MLSLAEEENIEEAKVPLLLSPLARVMFVGDTLNTHYTWPTLN